MTEKSEAAVEDLTQLLNETYEGDELKNDSGENGLEGPLILSGLARRLSAVIVHTAEENHKLRQRTDTLEEEGKKQERILHEVLKRLDDLERNSVIDSATGIYTDRFLPRAADIFAAQFNRHNMSFGVLGVDVHDLNRISSDEESVLSILAEKLGVSFRGYDQLIFSRERQFFTILLDKVVQKEQLEAVVQRVNAKICAICNTSLPMGAFLMQAGQEKGEKGNVVHTAIRGMRQSLSMWHEGGNVTILLNGA